MSAALELPSVTPSSPFLAPEDHVTAMEVELTALRRTLAGMRDPAGAIRLAVQILAGPLRPAVEALEPSAKAQVLSVLGALETSTQELCRSLERSGAANDRGTASPPDAVTPPVVPPSAVACPPAVPEAPPMLNVEALLRRLEVLTVTRSALPALLAVDAPPELTVASPGPDLLQVLCGLVENAIEASARAQPNRAPWTVHIRAFVDPADDLSDDLHVVFDIRDAGDGIPKEVAQWAADPDPDTTPSDGVGPGTTLRLARRVAEDAGGRLELLRVSKRTCVRLRLPVPQ